MAMLPRLESSAGAFGPEMTGATTRVSGLLDQDRKAARHMANRALYGFDPPMLSTQE